MNPLSRATVGGRTRCCPAAAADLTRRDINLAAWHRGRRRRGGRRGNGHPQHANHNHNSHDRRIENNGGKGLLGGNGSVEQRLHRRPSLLSATRVAPAIPDGGARGFSPRRFFNPWHELANVVRSEDVLHDKVESTTRTFGIVAALMGSLAAALFNRGNQYDGYDAVRDGPTRKEKEEGASNANAEGRGADANGTANDNNNSQQLPFAPSLLTRRNTRNFIEHVTFTHHVSGTSLLVSWGIPESQLDEIYTACCAGSFYTGVLTTVLSSIINAWLAATPCGAVRSFVKLHSWYIVSLPALLGISTSLAGAALFIGLDREHGTPVSYVGLGGSLAGGAAVGVVLGTGWMHNYRALTAAVARRGAWGK